MPRFASSTLVRAVALAATAVTLVAASADPAGAQRPRTAPRYPGLLRADSPEGTFPPTLPDPAIASAFNSVRDGINLNGIGYLRTPDPDDPQFGFYCTTQRIGPRTIVTAAHCVTDDLTGALLPTTGQARATFIGPGDARTRFDVANVRVRSDWLGFANVNSPFLADVAVVNFAAALPDWVTTYDVFDQVLAPGLAFQDTPVTLAGFGTYGNGTGPTEFGDFNRRWGRNYVDFTSAGDVFEGDDGVLYTTFEDAAGQYATTCVILGVCNPTQGATEAGRAARDSGGPLFLGGRLAAVLSYGAYWCDPAVLTDCVPFGISDPDRPFDSYGTLSAYVPLAPNLAFIRAATIPEPSTVLLVGAGGAVLAAAARRRGRRRVPVE